MPAARFPRDGGGSKNRPPNTDPNTEIAVFLLWRGGGAFGQPPRGEFVASGARLWRNLRGIVASGSRMWCNLQGIVASGARTWRNLRGIVASGARMLCNLRGIVAWGARMWSPPPNFQETAGGAKQYQRSTHPNTENCCFSALERGGAFSASTRRIRGLGGAPAA